MFEGDTIHGIATELRSASVGRPVYATASRLLRANLGGGRRRTVSGGYAVYGRAGRSCWRCGGVIRSRRQDGRTTWWCPGCQTRA